jgi:orotate phosphoribosyltransferase
MKDKDVLKLFEENGAFLTGHFRLSSGLHSQRYLQCALILQRPDLTEALAKELASKFRKEKIDFVIGPALGGVVLSYEMGRQLGVRSIFTERENDLMTLRRGFSVKAGEKGIVVEDVVTTGGSIAEVMKLIETLGGRIVGVASLIDRSKGVDFGVKFEALARVTIETYSQDSCPLCKKGIPVTKPGSRR